MGEQAVGEPSPEFALLVQNDNKYENKNSKAALLLEFEKAFGVKKRNVTNGAYKYLWWYQPANSPKIIDLSDPLCHVASHTRGTLEAFFGWRFKQQQQQQA